jgi:hypothetical protein
MLIKIMVVGNGIRAAYEIDIYHGKGNTNSFSIELTTDCSSLCSHGTDHTENTASNISSIVACVSIAAIT